MLVRIKRPILKEIFIEFYYLDQGITEKIIRTMSLQEFQEFTKITNNVLTEALKYK